MKKKKKILIIFSISLIVFVLLNMVGVLIAYNIIFFKPHDVDLNSHFNYDYQLYEKDYKREEITYSIGDYNLKGYAYLKNETSNLVITVHGIKDFADYLLEEDIFFLDNGYNVFSFDCSGCGKSEGYLNGFSQELIDLDKTLDFLNQDTRFKDYNKYLFGFSAGAYASASVLEFKHDIKGVCAISGYNDAKNLVFEKGKGYVGPLAYIGIPFVALKDQIIFNDYLDVLASNAINNSNTKVFIAHGDKDSTIPYSLSILKEFEDSNKVVKYSEDASHSGILYSKEAREYQKKMKDEEEINRSLYNELNKPLFDAILDFYASC